MHKAEYGISRPFVSVLSRFYASPPGASDSFEIEDLKRNQRFLRLEFTMDRERTLTQNVDCVFVQAVLQSE